MTGSSSDAVTAREARIIKQIEFYFGDANMLTDKFLNEKIQEDDGWVTMDTMLTFNRLKEITDNAQMVCEALKKSSSGLMEVSEQGDKIRRSPSKPLPGDTKERRDEINSRTVYAKPFPLDVKLDDLLEFFEGYGQLDKVFMKRHFQKKTFKGSVYVTFANREDAAKFVNEEETKLKKQALEVKWFKTKYYKHKAEKNKAKCKKDTEGNPYKKVEDETKEEEAEADLEERVSKIMTRNAVLHLKGLNFKTSRKQVKAFFFKHADFVWVDFDKGATEGYIIIRERESASSMLEKTKTANDGKVVIRDSEIEVRVVDGDEELQYWKKMFKDLADKKKNGGRDRGQGGINPRDWRYQTDWQKNRGGPEDTKNQNQKVDSDGEDSDGEEEDTEETTVKVITSEMVIKFQEVLKLKDASCDGEVQETEEPPAKVIKSEKVTTRPQSKRKQNKKDASSDLEEQGTKEITVKVIKSEIIIKFQEVMKLDDASSDGEEQDTDEPPAKVTKFEKIITRQQDKMKQNKKDASSDVEEQDTEEPPASFQKSEVIITRPQGKRRQNKKVNSSGDEQETGEPPAKVIKSKMIIRRPRDKSKQNKNLDSGGEEQDIEELPVRVIKSETIITRPQGKRKQNKKVDLSGEEQDTGEPPAKVIKSEMIITRKRGKRKQNKNLDSGGEEHDTEEVPVRVIKSEIIITRRQGKRKQNKKVDSCGEEQDTEEPPGKVIKSEMITMFQEVTTF